MPAVVGAVNVKLVGASKFAILTTGSVRSAGNDPYGVASRTPYCVMLPGDTVICIEAGVVAFTASPSTAALVPRVAEIRACNATIVLTLVLSMSVSSGIAPG